GQKRREDSPAEHREYAEQTGANQHLEQLRREPPLEFVVWLRHVSSHPRGGCLSLPGGESADLRLEGCGLLVLRRALDQNIRWGNVVVVVVCLVQAVPLGHDRSFERRAGVEPLDTDKTKNTRLRVAGPRRGARSDWASGDARTRAQLDAARQQGRHAAIPHDEQDALGAVSARLEAEARL